jgi:glyoxylase-like metal-dependent hydrolase (beta-lactamase superfamily II)
VFEGVDDTGDHGWGDMAVDTADAGEPVPESFGLGYLGNVVIDEPGFVGVAEVVEVHAGDDRRPSCTPVAVRGIMIPGLTWHRISFEPTKNPTLAPFLESFDVMGDGSLVMFPTPGHTAGSVSLLVRRRSKPPLLLVGDLTYGAELLGRRRVPGVGDRSQLAKTTDKVLALTQRMPGLVILPAHDPTAAQRLLHSAQ